MWRDGCGRDGCGRDGCGGMDVEVMGTQRWLPWGWGMADVDSMA